MLSILCACLGIMRQHSNRPQLQHSFLLFAQAKRHVFGSVMLVLRASISRPSSNPPRAQSRTPTFLVILRSSPASYTIYKRMSENRLEIMAELGAAVESGLDVGATRNVYSTVH
jgi:hypothetical protein